MIIIEAVSSIVVAFDANFSSAERMCVGMFYVYCLDAGGTCFSLTREKDTVMVRERQWDAYGRGATPFFYVCSAYIGSSQLYCGYIRFRAEFIIYIYTLVQGYPRIKPHTFQGPKRSSRLFCFRSMYILVQSCAISKLPLFCVYIKPIE